MQFLFYIQLSKLTKSIFRIFFFVLNLQSQYTYMYNIKYMKYILTNFFSVQFCISDLLIALIRNIASLDNI